MRAVRLVTVAHGTRDPAGAEVVRELTRLAAARLGLPGVAAFLELAEPSYAALADVPSAVVPLLLSTGHHVRHDLGGRPPLGPHRLLAAAQVGRLRDAGVEPGSPLVMVAAGSRDPRASRDLRRATDLLGEAWGTRVRLAALGGLGPRPEDVLRPGDAVSPYLLAPGHFADRCRDAAELAGATTAGVIGAHPAVVELVVRRARISPGRAPASPGCAGAPGSDPRRAARATG